MVLNGGIDYVTHLLGQKFTKIAVGTGSAPVTGSETSLTGQIEKDVTGVDYLGDGYFKFNSMLVGADPAMLIQEMGLINEDGDLMFRQVITPVNKVAGANYAIDYQIRLQ